MDTYRELVLLTQKQVRSLPKPRAGFLDFVDSLFTICESRREQLGAVSIDVGSLREDVATYNDLGERQRVLERELTDIRRSRVFYAARVWSGMLDIYQRCRWVARADGHVAYAIAGFARFLRKPTKHEPPAR